MVIGARVPSNTRGEITAVKGLASYRWPSRYKNTLQDMFGNGLASAVMISRVALIGAERKGKTRGIEKKAAFA